jgi:hypothetical protein
MISLPLARLFDPCGARTPRRITSAVISGHILGFSLGLTPQPQVPQHHFIYIIDQGSSCPLVTLNPFGRELLLSDVLAGICQCCQCCTLSVVLLVL